MPNANVELRQIGHKLPELLLTQEHHMCPGCGEPLALRGYLEAISELGLASRAIAVAGIGCSCGDAVASRPIRVTSRRALPSAQLVTLLNS